MMKPHVITSVLAVILCAHSTRAAEDFVIQTDLATGLTQHIYVEGPDTIGEESGTVDTALPVGPAGSHFALYGVGLAPDTKLYLLDQTVVGSFLPKATVKVSTEDPYTVVARTRSDRKFDVELTFEGLLTDENAPEAARRIYVERLVIEYPEGVDRIPENSQERVVEAFYVTKNGALNAQFNTSLVSSSPYKQRGEEYIRTYALPDADVGWTLLDEKKVQIWPVADAQLLANNASALEPFPLNGKTLGYMPSITMVVNDLYPTSKTYLNLYKGPKNDNPSDAQQISQNIIAQDYQPVAFNTITPQSATQTIDPDQWNSDDLTDGVYTVEILTVTPFNLGKPERLAHATFTLNRTIEVKGSLNVSEK
ncbi:hypothetical protein NT6N_00060 [Oceaniferula spumae]|uniref:IPT/TIG domain-containing protein n=1 Tax=Oceaniferula spumae TaxID=2979115 RepID=A0AAT9FG58_9BACT